jgi:hypothetical protein
LAHLKHHEIASGYAREVIKTPRLCHYPSRFVWVKYRERWGADYGEEGLRDTCLAAAAGLKSRTEPCEKIQSSIYGVPITQLVEAGLRRGHEDRSAARAYPEGFAGTHKSSAVPLGWRAANLCFSRHTSNLPGCVPTNSGRLRRAMDAARPSADYGKGTETRLSNLSAHQRWPATTRIYDRSGDQLTLQEIERVQIGKKQEI